MKEIQVNDKADKTTTQYKDTLLRTLYKDNERAIELCNALIGTDYPAHAPVIRCDLNDSLAKRFNDVAFIVEDQLLCVVEHQSTISKNLPLRLLAYVSDILNTIIETRALYEHKQFYIPTPQFFVLYNGKEKLKEKILKLSDAFKFKGAEIQLELIVHVIDVNYESMDWDRVNRSQSLTGYAYLIHLIGKFRSEGHGRDHAIKTAINQCINEGVLAEFLKNNFEVVVNMLTLEYNQELEHQVIREEGAEIAYLDVARSMLRGGYDTNIVAEMTRLSIDTIEKLQLELQ